jgi:mono/diheme cytochrome c family protein/glucose/arabinose dehydrogenase
MSIVRLLTAALFVGLAHGYQGPAGTSVWPPAVQGVPEVSPPLSPEEALKTFRMPPGYRIELVASEPLIQEPVAIDWDTAGRLWAVEMPGFMANITGSNERDPIGRVVVLEDTDGDGRMNKRTVFADGLVLARSLKVLAQGVLVAEPPNLWLMSDLDGDLHMDAKTLVTSRYGRREGDPQNNANGLHWGLDNRLYSAGQAEVELRLKDGVWAVQATLQRGEWGVTHDDAGRVYRNTNESALHVDFVPTSYFARNPNLLRTRGSYERLADEDNHLNVVWPVRPNPGTNRAYQMGIDRADGSLEKFTSVCAPLVYRGDRLPAELYGNVFVAEPAANLVSRLVLTRDDTTLRARKAYERGEFLASTDERFRPVFLSNAPDGTLYIADMYRGIVEHRLSLTVYLRDYILSRQLDRSTGFGRIYRVVHDTTRRDTSRDLLTAASPALVEMLSHPNGWRRDTAQRLLVERADRSVVPALTQLMLARDARTRLHALWTLDGIGEISPTLVGKALADRSPDLRSAAVRVAERWLSGPPQPIQLAVLMRVNDPAWEVRHQLAASIGLLDPGRRESAAVSMLQHHAADPVVVDAVLSGLRGIELAVLHRFARSPSLPATEATDAATTMLAATIVRSGQDTQIQDLFAWAADGTRPERERAAVVRGMAVALTGAPMPGTRSDRPAPANSVSPCPTCPGGRAGPGGAYAYSTPEDFVDASGRAAGRGGARMLRLNRKPDVPSAGDSLQSRVESVLARVTWPGKPGDAPVVPLSTEEQAQFNAGRDVYANVCQACHQPDGRGQDKIAASLIDSRLALAPSDIPIRILLNGKEGATGLMPPIGATLTDDQIANVLTYIRRDWGHSGTPVSSATVKTVREKSAGRTRPWSDEELLKLMGATAAAR